jgi:hypothetical protein
VSRDERVAVVAVGVVFGQILQKRLYRGLYEINVRSATTATQTGNAGRHARVGWANWLDPRLRILPLTALTLNFKIAVARLESNNRHLQRFLCTDRMPASGRQSRHSEAPT